ncbi:MAG: M42 family metallopeptidase [Saccharofermentanales bacterium]|jgi:putative aminopeptidase FrvX
MIDAQLIQTIGAFSDAYGPSGYEHEVADLAIRQAGAYGNAERDTIQNVFIHRNGNTGDRLRVQLDAHLDEVGLIVQSIRANGLLRVLPLGSWVPGNIPAHVFRVRSRDGKWVRAIAASTPPHYLTDEQRKQGVSMDQIELDIGARSKEEVEADFNIDIAAPVVPDVEFHYDEDHDLLLGKAFDCRIGCAVMTEVLRRLDGVDLDVDVIAGYTSQEEIGGRGVIVATRQIEPDVAIVFEGTPADDNFAPADKMQTALGGGPMLRHIDRSMVTHPGFQKYALAVARAGDIPVQAGVRSGGGTNGGLIHTQGQGIPTIVIGVPVRYIHTHYGWAKASDADAAAALGAALIKSFDDTALERFTY